MRTIKVNTKKTYGIYIDEDIINKVSSLLLSNGIDANKKALVITDTNVEKLYLNEILETLINAGFICNRYVINAGEEYKSLSTVENILRYLASNNYQKKDVLISLGGGVIGDITGLCASLYMRGVDYVQIPTTLLSAVDASVGGKTAVDLPEGKNLVGTFYQPKFVLCDLDILKRLPDNIYKEGLAEVIKYGIIKDSIILDLINNEKNNLEEIVFRCLSIKSNIVSDDENDNGIRKILNYGHTFAHALEKCSNYSISHGKAVAEGLLFETKLSANMNKCTREYFHYIENIIHSNFKMNNIYSMHQIIEAMKNDKKNVSNKISFVLVDGNNNSMIEEIEETIIERTYKEIYG